MSPWRVWKPLQLEEKEVFQTCHMLSIALLIPLIFGQTCISLKGSKNCQGLEAYAVLPSKEFSNLNSLDAYLDSGTFNNTGFITAFKSSFQCPQYVGKGGRFGLSTYCAFVSPNPYSC